jgi:glyoxylase-like metal-dependent hydrolase (beta-lactamase superfamily II)
VSFESANPREREPEADEAELLERARSAGIIRLKVPTPFLVGPVNCWLIEDQPLTLVDTGPNSGTSLDQLSLALGDAGHSIEDLELIFLTHQHMDHLGLLDILQRRSGAEVAALAPLAPWLAAFPESAKQDDRWAQALMRRHGVPEDLVTVLGMVADAFRPYGSRGTVTRELHDGDELKLRDRTLGVLHRPGHSPTDTVLWDSSQRILLAGDHLLSHISSNAVLTRAPDGSDDENRGPRPTPLLEYIESMKKTRELDAQLVLGGHGAPVAEPAPLIDARLRMHDRRAEKIRRMLVEKPLSAYDIALTMWGNIAVTQAFLTLSEVLGHVDLLLRDGLVAERAEDGVVRFHAAP